MNWVNPMSNRSDSFRRLLLMVVLGGSLNACTTITIEDSRESTTGLLEGEGLVVIAKSYHLGNETEANFTSCVSNAVGRGSSGLRVIPGDEFVDALFPWFEPRTAPAEIKGLSTLMSRPGVAEKIKEKGVRYIVWIDGDTEKVAGGGSMSCAAGPGGGGCFGFAWWTNDARYEATVWDLNGLESVGTVSTDVSGTSYVPALIVPIPMIARAQTKACKGLSQQLKLFIDSDEAA